MSIEAYGTYDEDTQDYSFSSFPTERNWEHRSVSLGGESLSHLMKPTAPDHNISRNWEGVKPCGDVSGEVKVSIKLGPDKKDTKITASGTAGYQDNRGRYLETEIKYDNDRNTEIDVKAGRKPKK